MALPEKKKGNLYPGYDYNSSLWPVKEHFFRDFEFHWDHIDSGNCVVQVLSLLTGDKMMDLADRINTQDPHSWSESLKPHGLKLAYCPTDVRKLSFYMEELINHDDLFLLCYYTVRASVDILSDPDEKGWICGSHIVVLHRSRILSPTLKMSRDARNHPCNGMHTKRIFRVVPAGHPRGL